MDLLQLQDAKQPKKPPGDYQLFVQVGTLFLGDLSGLKRKSGNDQKCYQTALESKFFQFGLSWSLA